MSEPLTAEYRLELTIVVAALVHKLRHYAEASPSLLSADGYFLFDRSGIASIQPRDAAAVWWAALKPAYNTTVAPPTWILHNRVGPVWNPVASGTLSGNGTNTSGIVYASQLTISLRTDNFKRVRQILMEQSTADHATKYFGYTDLHTNLPDLADCLVGTFGGGNNLHEWVRSRNKRELAESAPIISTTFDLNDKLRRARGVQ